MKLFECFFQEKNLDWFPRMRAMSLSDAEGDSEQNELRTLQTRLENTNQLIVKLSSQLNELREQVICVTIIIVLSTRPDAQNLVKFMPSFCLRCFTLLVRHYKWQSSL